MAQRSGRAATFDWGRKMSVQAIGSQLNTSSPSATSNAGVNEKDFIKLFVSELQFQDPMQPLDNSQFLTQLAQFVSIEQQSEQVTGINNLLTLNSSVGEFAWSHHPDGQRGWLSHVRQGDGH
jgi:flagellar basal-body rod modification protein FlgD